MHPQRRKRSKLYQNLETITLLNTDYEILTSILANRLERDFPEIISPSQSGFLGGRFIGENRRWLFGILEYSECQDIPGLLLWLDFEKAVDSVEWSFIDKALHSFHIGSFFYGLEYVTLIVKVV